MTRRPVSRRAVLASGVGVGAALAGCISTSATPPNVSSEGSDEGASGPVLRSGGSSTVYPIVSTAAGYWSTNEPYWHPDVYGIETQQHLADYWAGLYGFGPADGGAPPFSIRVSLSHSGTGLEKLRSGRLDMGNASAPVKAEFPDLSQSELGKYTDHVVGVDAQPIVVSQAIYDAGITEISAKTLKAIYQGEIENWRDVPGYSGPPKEIQAVGRAEGSGTDTAFRSNLFGNSNAPIPGVDIRKGENQQVKQIVNGSDNAIAYMALAFVDDSVPSIALKAGGTTYTPGENLAEAGYPLARDLHCYTYDGTSKKEAALLRMLLSEYGQETFVAAAGYSVLPTDRRRNQTRKLPAPTR